MASDFIPLNDKDTKELRKEIGLPITKGIVYWRKDLSSAWTQLQVFDYEVVATYEPSGSKSLKIVLEDGSQERILGDYLADMQKTSFLSDVDGDTEKTKVISGKTGERIDCNVKSYIVVDLETTGTNHFKDAITEIGAVKYELGKEVERFDMFVNTDIEIPKKVEKLTGISNDLLRLLGVEPKEACEQFKTFIGESVLVGHNFTSFDSKFLEDAFVKELNCHFSNDYIDTLYLARKKLPDCKHHSLECLSEEYGIDYSKAHRAVEDCVINHAVYEYLAFGCLLCDEFGENSAVENSDAGQETSTSEKIGVAAQEDELVEVVATEEWQAKMSAQFIKFEEEFNLPKHSLSIMANVGKEGKISSYAICVYEPDLVESSRDSSRNTVLARVKEGVLKSNSNIVEVYSKTFEKKRFDKDSDILIGCLSDCIRRGILNYVPKAATFACCSRYQECSNAKKCIHPNVLYAKACQYRKNLEKGNIFY